MVVNLPARSAARAAYVAAGLHLAAATMTLLVLQPGLPTATTAAEARLAYAADRAALWWAGWLVWHAAAIALLGFYVALASRWQRRAPLRCALALLCAAAGLAVDLGAQGMYMGVAPRLSPQEFALVETAVLVLMGYVGNGLYTLAGVLLVWAGAGELPGYLLLLSLPIWGAGLGLSATSLAGSASGQVWSTAVLMPTLVLWAALMGRWLGARAS